MRWKSGRGVSEGSPRQLAAGERAANSRIVVLGTCLGCKLPLRDLVCPFSYPKAYSFKSTVFTLAYITRVVTSDQMKMALVLF